MRLHDGTGSTRRFDDRVLARFVAMWSKSGTSDGPDPVLMGRTLLCLSGALTVVAAAYLGLGEHAWAVLAGVSVVMAGTVLVSLVIPWPKLPQSALLAFPAVAFCGFATLGKFGGPPQTYAPVMSFFTLCFLYAGLTQQRHTSLLLLPFSGTAMVLIYGGLDAAVGVRLVFTSCVWVIVSEVLSAFVRRQRVMSASLQSAAYSDTLTGLANRRDLDVRLASAVIGTCVIICDLDHFKRLNDTLGHSAGDDVLAQFGTTLRHVLRTVDYCARYGGEEFVLLLPAAPLANVQIMLDRLRDAWRVMRPDVTFSAGVAFCRSGRSPFATLGAADRALYEAKAAGRNTDRAEIDVRV